MAYTTENNYTGNGSTRLYSFTFPYLEDTDIKVSLNQTATTNFTLANATQIQFSAPDGGATSTQAADGAPKNTVAIKIYRDTDISNLQSEFFSGSAVRAQDLNNDFNQTLYVSQETEKAVEGKWNDTTQTIASSEAFVDSNDYIMTAAAIDDRIIAKQAARALADGKIIVGNGSGVGAQVTPSGDVTMANTGAFTIANTSVENGMIANDAINGAKIADDAIDSEHYADGSIDTAHYAAGSVDSTAIADGTIVNTDISGSASIAHSKLASLTDGRILVGNGSNVPVGVTVSGDVTLANTGAVTIASGAVEHAMLAADAVDGDNIANDSINSEHYVDDSIDTAHIADANVTLAKVENVTDGQIVVGNGSNRPTAVAVSGDVTIANTGAVTIANDAVETAMIGSRQTTISDSDSHIPTSGAVVDYVASKLAPIGGLEVIDDDESFEEVGDMPPAGVVVSITDAAGLSVNSSGVSTNADTKDTNATVTINGFPTELRGGQGSNADPYVFGAGAGLMVVSTGSSNTYNYHQAMIREADFVQLSDDINDFKARYRVAAAASGVRTGQCGADGTGNGSYPCDGDMAWFTGSNKMYVFDAPAASTGNSDLDAAWKEVTSTGDYKLLTIKDHDQAVGGSGPTFNGSNEEFDLFDGSADASITNAGQLLVSLNGVIQKPNTGTFSGSEEGFYLNDTHGIKFCDPPPSGSSLFVTQIGTAVSIPTPGDNTVTAAKIVNGAVGNNQLGADAVDATKIADDAIGAEHIADNAVGLDALWSDTGGKVLTWDSSNNPIAVGPGSGGQVLTSAGSGTSAVWSAIPNQLTDNSVTLAKMAGGTDGNLITYDTSGDPAFVVTGNSGQVLTSNGAGAAPTFQTISTTDTLSFRNLIINGAFQIAQRGTSSTSTVYKTVDRWMGLWGGTDENCTQAQVTLSSSDSGPWAKGFRNAFQITNGNQTSGAGANDYVELSTRIEARDVANSGWDYSSASSKLALSFWVKSSVAQNFYGRLQSINGTDQNYPFETGSLSANTWAKITKIIPGGEANLQFDNTNVAGLDLFIIPFQGTDRTATPTLNAWNAYSSSTKSPDMTSTWYTTNDSTFAITGVQLEVASAATEFEHRSFGEELIRCQRYYEKTYAYGTAPGTATDTGRRLRRTQASASSGTQFTNEQYQVVKRTTPTITTYSTDGTSGEVFIANYGISGSHVSSSTYGVSDQGFEMLTGTVTANAIGGFWTAEAEL